jgi:hypothetical protein
MRRFWFINKDAIEKALNGKTQKRSLFEQYQMKFLKVKEIFAFQPALFGGGWQDSFANAVFSIY